MSHNIVTPKRPLNWPEIVAQIAKSARQPDNLYLVGGAVRDALRGRPIIDLDLAGSLSGSSTARQLANSLGGNYFTLDSERDIGRALIHTRNGEIRVDVSTFRGNGLHDDLASRDFTINAMAVRLDRLNEIIDPLGGQDDLFKLKILKQCGPSSILDDPLRAMRAVRQSLQFGLRMDVAVVEAIKQTPQLLFDAGGSPLHAERMRDELFRLVGHVKAGSTFRVLHALGLLRPLGIVSDLDDNGVEQRFAVADTLSNLITVISPKRDDNTAADLTLGVAVMVLDAHRGQLQSYLTEALTAQRQRQTLIFVAGLAPAGLIDWEQWGNQYALSNAEKRFLSNLEAARQSGLKLSSIVDDRLIYQYFRDSHTAGIAGIFVMLAEYLAAHFPTPPAADWGSLLQEGAAPIVQAYFERTTEVISPLPLLTGAELQDQFNLAPGPQIGDLLESLREEQAAGHIHSKLDAVKFARRRLKNGA